MAEIGEPVLDEVTAQKADQVRRCAVSLQHRRANADDLWAWYERGTDTGPRAAVNKLRSHLDRVASYLYSPDSTRFGVRLPVAQRVEWMEAAQVARDDFRERWTDSGTDLVCSALIEWALVYSAMIAKIQHDPLTGFRTDLIMPWDFGVIREDVPSLDEQDAFAHYYSLSLPQVERWVYGQPGEERLLRIAHEHKALSPPGAPRTGLVLSSIQGIWPNSTVEGGFPGEPDSMSDVMSPSVDEPCVKFVDLWERRIFRRKYPFGKKPDLFEDWEVTTMIADANVIFSQRRNPDLPWTRTGSDVTLPSEHPFVMIVPRPLPGYAWGRSELAGLRLLQQWQEKQMESMREGVVRMLDPSKFFSGVPDFEEANRSMSTPGGGFATAEPGAKMEVLKPEFSQSVFEFLNILNRSFAEASGVPESLSEPGGLPGGVRNTGQFAQVSNIGAGRIRRMALIMEDAIGQIATKGFRILQRHETQAYPLKNGKTFLLSQLPPGMTLRVNAHSSAPIFQEQTTNKAVIMKRVGAIDSPDFVDLIDPPNRDELMEKARKLDEAKAAAAQEKLQIEHEKATRSRASSRSR